MQGSAPTSSTPAWLARILSRSGLIAAVLLSLMFVLGVTSMAKDSAIFDETAHVAAAYSYVRYGDFRLNPEHPPLIKDLAGVPLQFMNLSFPDTHPAWTEQVNGQWDLGRIFLYHAGNDADRILFWARLPLLLLGIGFGAFLYLFCKGRFGREAALLTVFFYALSPNLIAHSRFITTDLGISFASFLVVVAFVRFLEGPSLRRVLMLSLALAGAQVVKFSAALLFPYLVGWTFLAICFWPRPERVWDRVKVYAGGLIVASVLSVCLALLFYALHMRNMPLAVQDHLILGSFGTRRLLRAAHFLTELNKLPLMQPLAQYLLGLAMVFGRVAGGGGTYFNGVFQVGSFRGYFPELFLLKTQLSFLILALAVLVAAVPRFRSAARSGGLSAIVAPIREHTMLWALGGYSAFYFAVAVAGTLNLGIRHLLPMYAPLFVLVAVGLVALLRDLAAATSRVRAIASGGIALMLGWYGLATVVIHPNYVAYFNELIGGPSHGSAYFSDSSIDWGQDLRRLESFLREHPEIKRLGVDYFGGGDVGAKLAPVTLPVKYYLCPGLRDTRPAALAESGSFECDGRTFEPWHSADGPYPGPYIAVSVTTLVNEFPDGGYAYLRRLKPIAQVGYSIHVYALR